MNFFKVSYLAVTNQCAMTFDGYTPVGTDPGDKIKTTTSAQRLQYSRSIIAPASSSIEGIDPLAGTQRPAEERPCPVYEYNPNDVVSIRRAQS